MNHPLNTILYGPPGTGKTYTTFRRCVEICDEAASHLTRKEVRSRYGELVAKGRVEFITFHQSYGYEEFVEGLRPETKGGGGGLRLVVRDGVLKRVAERARQPPKIDSRGRRFYKVSLGPVDERVFKECMEDGCVRFEWWNDQDWSDSECDKWTHLFERIKERDPDSRLVFTRVIAARHFRCSMKDGDIVVVPDGISRSAYRAVGEIIGGYEYRPLDSHPHCGHRRPVRWLWKAEGKGRPVRDFQNKYFGAHYVHSLRITRRYCSRT